MMSNKTRALSVWSAGVLLSSLAANPVMAVNPVNNPASVAQTECGQATLVKEGSVGANVTNNNCVETSRLKLGATVELPSGSRMWLKFDPIAGESFQLICQNKSANPVSVEVTSTKAPWIKPQGLKDCDKWNGNKLSCDTAEGEKSSFFCAIASTKLKAVKRSPEVTTSMKMRSLKPMTLLTKEEIIQSMKPEIELCKNLYNVSDALNMSWTISSAGIIKDLNVNSQNTDLVACVEGVVKQVNAKQDLTMKYSF